MSRLGRLLKLKAPSRVRFYTHVTMVMSFMEGYARIQQLVDGIAYLEEPFNDLNEDLNYFEAYIKTVEPLIKWIEKLEVLQFNKNLFVIIFRHETAQHHRKFCQLLPKSKLVGSTNCKEMEQQLSEIWQRRH